jgi:hypothetical protein
MPEIRSRLAGLTMCAPDRFWPVLAWPWRAAGPAAPGAQVK